MSYNYRQFLELGENDYDKVINLNFDNNQLTELPNSIGKCSQLEALYCENNQLTELPETLGDHKQLEILYCHKNQLTELPETLGNCRELKYLMCFSNQLIQLPESIGNCSQDLVNLGNDMTFQLKSTYNALNGYNAPTNPLPYKDQFSDSMGSRIIV